MRTGVDEQGARNREALLLPAAQLHAALPDHRVVLLREVVHELVSVGLPARLDDLLLSRWNLTCTKTTPLQKLAREFGQTPATLWRLRCWVP